MHEKRYQVFISSTFEDLRDERRAVQDVIISTGDFPVQMETFPAADEDQFEFIKSLIDQCDYYVLIIGGRYGTIADDGLSYTHKEFRYAVLKGVPVLVMLHEERSEIPVGKSENTSEGRERLSDFISEAQQGRLRKGWTTLDGLKLAVREALDYAKATKPRIGWVRGNVIANIDTLEELNKVRKENEKFRETLGNAAIELPLPDLPSATDEVIVSLSAKVVGNSVTGFMSGTNARIKTTWIAMFPTYFFNLKWKAGYWNGENYHDVDIDGSCYAIGESIASEFIPLDTESLFKLSKSSFERLSSYYIEAGLETTKGENRFTEIAEKFANRHRISNATTPGFVVVEGEVRVFSPVSAFVATSDDIPF